MTIVSVFSQILDTPSWILDSTIFSILTQEITEINAKSSRNPYENWEKLQKYLQNFTAFIRRTGNLMVALATLNDEHIIGISKRPADNEGAAAESLSPIE